jgi:hypothetical protein
VNTANDDRAWLETALANLEPMLKHYGNADGSDVWAGLAAMKLGASGALTALEALAAVPSPSTG